MKELYTVEADDGRTFDTSGEFTIQSVTTNKYLYCDFSKGNKITLSSDHPSYFLFVARADGFNSAENWGAILFNRSPVSPTSVEKYRLKIEENTNPTANVIAVQDGTPTWRRGTGAFMFYKNSDGTYRIASPEIGLSGTPTIFIGIDRDTYSKVLTTIAPGVQSENWKIQFTGKGFMNINVADIKPPTIISGSVLTLPPIDAGGILGISTPSPYKDAQWFETRNNTPTSLTFTPGPVPPMFVPTSVDTPSPSPAADNSMWIWIGVGVGVFFLLILFFMLLKKKPAQPIKR
jgi:hypothetical protein